MNKNVELLVSVGALIGLLVVLGMVLAELPSQAEIKTVIEGFNGVPK